MLTSLLNNETVNAKYAVDKNADYRCPECGQPTILRRGLYKVPHFAHKVADGCTFGEGMTEEHLIVQQELYDLLISKGFHCELECRRFKNHRADVYADIHGDRVVFEVQHSSITPQEVLARNQFYSQEGCSVIWILTPDFFGRMKARVNPKKGVKLNLWQRRINDIYGCVYVWWNKSLMAFQFDPAIRDEEFNPMTGEYDSVEEYQLKTTFDKIGYAQIDLLKAIDNRLLIPFVDDMFGTSCYGLSPDIDYAADWKFPDKHYRFDDPLSVAG